MIQNPRAQIRKQNKKPFSSSSLEIAISNRDTELSQVKQKEKYSVLPFSYASTSLGKRPVLEL